MEQIKTKGLILKVINLNDNDRIFTVLTLDYGKITVMAKGIRSQKNKYFGAMQLFCYSDFVFEKRTGMYFPQGAELIDNFFDIRNSVEKVALATYITDVVNAIPDEFPIDNKYFSFILNSLYVISKMDANASNFKQKLYKLKFVFEMKTVCENGYSPQVTSCGFCGVVKDIKYFDVSTGCIVCNNCLQKCGKSELIEIDTNLHKALYYVYNCDLRSVLSLGFDDGVSVSSSNLSERYMKYQMEILPTSVEYLNNILQNNQ